MCSAKTIALVSQTGQVGMTTNQMVAIYRPENIEELRRTGTLAVAAVHGMTSALALAGRSCVTLKPYLKNMRW